MLNLIFYSVWLFIYPLILINNTLLTIKTVYSIINLTHCLFISILVILYFLSYISLYNINTILLLSQTYFISDIINHYVWNMKNKLIFTIHHVICIGCQEYALYYSNMVDKELIFITLGIAEITNIPYLLSYSLYCYNGIKYKCLIYIQVFGFLIIRPLITMYILYNITEKYIMVPALLILLGSLYWGINAYKSI